MIHLCIDDLPCQEFSQPYNKWNLCMFLAHPTLQIGGLGPYCSYQKLAHEWWETFRNH